MSETNEAREGEIMKQVLVTSLEVLVDWPCALKARFGSAQCILNFNDLNHLTLTKARSAYQSPTVYFFNDHVID